MSKLRPKYAVLVYQVGIANVFVVKSLNLADYGRKARRVYQGSFLEAIRFAQGMGEAGCIVRTAACNQAGDITNSQWTEDLDSQPFSDKLVDLHIN